MLKFRFQLCVGPLTSLVFQNACLFLFRELSRDFPSSAWGTAWLPGHQLRLLQLSLNYRDNFNFRIMRNINCSSNLRN